MAHSQSNGQVKQANGLILGGLKSRLVKSLEKAGGKWIDELPSVILSLITTPNQSNCCTLFFMVYEAETVLPSDLEHDSPRVSCYIEKNEELERQDDLDALRESPGDHSGQIGYLPAATSSLSSMRSKRSGVQRRRSRATPDPR